ncbi:hypothetical protein VC83_08183 [Pseudogymnoascus destructans]|uniref:Mediator of RNA polymerase II transcription subunit 11 n=2 Tax=Pseudogymnoascus destructans TaxID=655981 RepID=L8FYL7_PSED2|nr:uncharacterized protein VC83_08183 [Pseudogymnoascus destructans]ELR05967.1 hypothetical protein GMDG_01929 [Pseudogymnoascus destructans 20631-21]OAF55291.1 hypothetical protein VC83_08183 [Pseudogymnoascus destructans]
MSSDLDKQPISSKHLTKAERIKQLNEIDQSITKLLESASLAIKSLTSINSPSETSASRRETFTAATDTYLKDLHSVDVRLKRQIKGLDDAGVIKAEPETEEEGDKGKQAPETKNGAIDVGWLNTRGNKVGRDMEAELWEKARNFLDGLEAKKSGGSLPGQDGRGTEGRGESNGDAMDTS